MPRAKLPSTDSPAASNPMDLRGLLDRVELFFRVEKKDGKEVSVFVRGFIFVKPGVLPEISTAACRVRVPDPF